MKEMRNRWVAERRGLRWLQVYHWCADNPGKGKVLGASGGQGAVEQTEQNKQTKDQLWQPPVKPLSIFLLKKQTKYDMSNAQMLLLTLRAYTSIHTLLIQHICSAWCDPYVQHLRLIRNWFEISTGSKPALELAWWKRAISATSTVVQFYQQIILHYKTKNINEKNNNTIIYF